MWDRLFQRGMRLRRLRLLLNTFPRYLSLDAGQGQSLTQGPVLMGTAAVALRQPETVLPSPCNKDVL